MNEDARLGSLSTALYLFGAIFVVGIFVMMRWVFPSGWSWTPAQPEYEQMILGVYAILGIFLIRAAKDPLSHLSLIWFAIWSSIVQQRTL